MSAIWIDRKDFYTMSDDFNPKIVGSSAPGERMPPLTWLGLVVRSIRPICASFV